MKTISGLKAFSLLGGLAALFLLSGCFETKQEFTLNSDGSGKVVHASTFQTMDISGSSQRDAARQMKAAVADIISRSQGVEAWRDVSYELLDDGRIAFRGTAYFRNLAELDIPNQTMLEFDWVRDGGAGTLSLRAKDGPQGKKSVVQSAPENLTPQQAALKIKEGRAKYQQMRAMMTMIVGAMKHEVVFHLPGRIGKSAAFQKEGADTLSLQFEGMKMIEAMDALINDDAWMVRNSGIMDPEAGPPMDEEMSQLLFGEKGPVQATVTGLGKAAFDYETEVAEAQEAFAALRQELGAKAPTIAAPAQSGELKSVQVLGVRLVRETPEGLDVRPFSEEAGYTLSLLAELPGSVLAMTDECVLETAIADDGSDLLPESEWSRRISFPNLSEDKAHVIFEVRLALPGPDVKVLREVSGRLQYTVAGDTKEVDLGFTKLATGADGRELGAHIESIDDESVELKLEARPDDIKALFLVVGSNKTELNRNGYSGYNDSYTYTYQSETGFPAKARLVAEVYADLQTFDAPFKLENLTLLGEPAE